MGTPAGECGHTGASAEKMQAMNQLLQVEGHSSVRAASPHVRD